MTKQSQKNSSVSVRDRLLDLAWPLPDELNDEQLARLFYPEADTSVSSRHQVPDWPTVHQELKRKGMTKRKRPAIYRSTPTYSGLPFLNFAV